MEIRNSITMECIKMIEVCQNDEYIKVPCGKCGFCLQAKRTSWMFRIYWEIFHQINPGWFLTLTYSEKYVKRAPDGRLSLRFRDIQLFLKKLRKAHYYAKYICVGEYGGQTKRPHYHMLLWTDCPILELETFWSTKKGKIMGSIHTGRITMESAMYTLKYILQPKQLHEEGVEPTRAQFSQGIGLAYLSTDVYNYHTHNYESPNFTSVVDGRTVALPRYYQYKIFTKYQRRGERVRLSVKRWKEKRKLYTKLRAKGIKKIRWYLQAIQLEKACRIIQKTKFNQTI